MAQTVTSWNRIEHDAKLTKIDVSFDGAQYFRYAEGVMSEERIEEHMQTIKAIYNDALVHITHS